MEIKMGFCPEIEKLTQGTYMETSPREPKLPVIGEESADNLLLKQRGRQHSAPSPPHPAP